MGKALTPTQKEKIGKLFEQYFNDFFSLVCTRDENIFLELPPEVILTVGDVSNIVNKGQSIDVIEPQNYDTVSTLTRNSFMLEEAPPRLRTDGNIYVMADNGNELGNFYKDFVKEQLPIRENFSSDRDYEEAVWVVSGSGGDVWIKANEDL